MLLETRNLRLLLLWRVALELVVEDLVLDELGVGLVELLVRGEVLLVVLVVVVMGVILVGLVLNMLFAHLLCVVFVFMLFFKYLRKLIILERRRRTVLEVLTGSSSLS